MTTGRELILTIDEVQETNMEITHKKGDLIFGVNNKPILYPAEEEFITAIECRIKQSDNNFGTGIIMVTSKRVVFIGKAHIDGLVSGALRAAGKGKTYFVFSKAKVISAEKVGLIEKHCKLTILDKGLFGGDKKVKYKILPGVVRPEYADIVVDGINKMLKGG